MNRPAYKLYYERHLLHIQPPGVTLFVTFRLAGSDSCWGFTAVTRRRRTNRVCSGRYWGWPGSQASGLSWTAKTFRPMGCCA